MSVMFCDNTSFSIHARDKKNYNESYGAENAFREVPLAIRNNNVHPCVPENPACRKK